jgi:hypothetical protein
MSKGPGRVMRSISAAISAEPKRRFTYDELKAIAYDGLPAPTHKPEYDARLVVVRRVVQALVSAKRASLGTDTVHWLRTVRAYDPDPLKVAQVQSPA